MMIIWAYEAVELKQLRFKKEEYSWTQKLKTEVENTNAETCYYDYMPKLNILHKHNA